MADDDKTAPTEGGLHYGVFTRKNPGGGDDFRLVAYTPADAVKYRFGGWTEDEPATAPEPGTPLNEPGTGDMAGDSGGASAKTAKNTSKQ